MNVNYLSFNIARNGINEFTPFTTSTQIKQLTSAIWMASHWIRFHASMHQKVERDSSEQVTKLIIFNFSTLFKFFLSTMSLISINLLTLMITSTVKRSKPENIQFQAVQVFSIECFIGLEIMSLLRYQNQIRNFISFLTFT